MLKIHACTEPTDKVDGELCLPFESRQKSRLLAQLQDGREVGLMLPRGGVLRSGDCLQAEDGSIIRVVAADEEVSTAYHDDPLMIARACYHLGNRHVPLQIASGWVRYQHDHVLDDMVRGLGLQVSFETAPFEPEGGAYGGHSHSHSHEHSHSHPHTHQEHPGHGH